MIAFREVDDADPALAFSPLVRGVEKTFTWIGEHGGIPLTPSKAFKRVFVHWAAENFEWPGVNAEELFRYNKVLNEYEFPPLEVLHFLLTELRLGRHYKGEFRITKRGKELAQAPGQLFAEVIAFYLLNIDHASYSRFEEQPLGTWDIWLNVLNVEVDHGAAET